VKNRLPIVLSATTLVVALFGSTPLGHAAGAELRSGFVDARAVSVPAYNVVVGKRGKRGPRGFRGPRGPKGATGPAGLRGPTGPTGVGLKGDKGNRGATGPTGPNGTTYSPGSGLSLSGTTFSVDFGGGHDQVPRGDHTHFGQSWSGGSTGGAGLVVTNTNAGSLGTYGVVGRQGDPSGVSPGEMAGVWGDGNASGGGVPSAGVLGTSHGGNGVVGRSDTGTGVYGKTTSGKAGLFDGDVQINGEVGVGGGDVAIGTSPVPSWSNSLVTSGPIRAGTGNQSNCDIYIADDTCFYDEQNGTLSVRTFAGTAFATVKALSFAVASDRAVKRDFRHVDPGAILRVLAGLPIQTWSFKSDSRRTRHLGPMAQDFAKAFHLGASNKNIDLIDGQGVSMAAIKGLYAMAQKQQRQIASLQAQVRVLKRH
jgi:hypothetical protein